VPFEPEPSKVTFVPTNVAMLPLIGFAAVPLIVTAMTAVMFSAVMLPSPVSSPCSWSSCTGSSPPKQPDNPTVKSETTTSQPQLFLMATTTSARPLVWPDKYLLRRFASASTRLGVSS